MPVRHAADLVGRFVSSFHPRSLPPMLRANYARELTAWMILPVMLGAVDGGVMGIIVKKGFADVPGISDTLLNLAVAAVASAIAVANITSFVWATLSHGRPKIRFIAALQVMTAVVVALIALVPHNLPGLIALVALVILARICWAGVITIRTSVWAANYPRANRARIAGKMATVQSLVMTGVSVLLGWAMDWNANAFHWFFPVIAVVALGGSFVYRKVRLRGQRRLARAEQAGQVHERPTLNPASVARVLRDDPSYRRFMLWMFVFGFGNIMVTAPLAIVLNDVFHVDYLQGILITSSIPFILMPLSIPIWSRMLGTRHVVEFRVIHCWSFVALTAMMLAGTAFQRLELMFLAAILMGIAYGGGVLAWNLGHHDFAPPNRDAQYMGVHVTLTGLRGLFAPLLAVGIYNLLESRYESGYLVFAVCLGLNLIGTLGFIHFRNQLRRDAVDGIVAVGR